MTGKEHIKYFCNILKYDVSQSEIEDLFKSIGLENGLNLRLKVLFWDEKETRDYTSCS